MTFRTTPAHDRSPKPDGGRVTFRFTAEQAAEIDRLAAVLGVEPARPTGSPAAELLRFALDYLSQNHPKLRSQR